MKTRILRMAVSVDMFKAMLSEHRDVGFKINILKGVPDDAELIHWERTYSDTVELYYLTDHEYGTKLNSINIPLFIAEAKKEFITPLIDYKAKIKKGLIDLKKEIQDEQHRQKVQITPNSICYTIDKKIKEMEL